MAVCRPAEIDEARKLFFSGQYAEAARIADVEWREKDYSEQWPLLLVESLQAVGRHNEAYDVLTNRLARESRSVQLRWIGREVCQATGRPDQGSELIKEIIDLVAARPWAYRDVADVVVFGRALLAVGTDAKLVLDRVYEVAKKSEPAAREPFLAIGELALEKQDFALAARTFRGGLAKHPKDADLHHGLARAYERTDTAEMLKSLQAALEHNSNHVASLLLLADHAIDAEDYGEAARLLDRVRSVNPSNSDAWAYGALLARLHNEPDLERAALGKALQGWPTNPRVPHLIGRKLSQKYRFAEGAALQRQALQFDPQFLAAKSQLAQDLLRLGEEEEGWRLAEKVHEQDGYNVTALNLLTLRDTLTGFRVLTNAHFAVRMPAQEAAVYGRRVIELLEEARQRLCPRYGMALARPVKVEIFAQQSDFAVRTFGLPENQGFLGVCFGPVITANSPAARPGRPFNWEAMLWHEFCHAVTLQLTRNRMPRWLSEGLSVYEERRANPAWGEKLVPRYREMILGGDLVPISQLSGAFLAPKSPLHLQFAYYESSLVVEYLIDKFGFDRLVAILRELGGGTDIEAAISKHAARVPEIEKGFAEFASRKATALAPGLDWERPGREVLQRGADGPEWETWATARPTNYWVLTRKAQRAAEERRWQQVKSISKLIVERYPNCTGPDSAWRLLAEAHRSLGEFADEQRALERLAELDGEVPDVYLRLAELAREAGDWAAAAKNARRYLAVNPLVPAPHRLLAEAAEKTGEIASAVGALRALLELDPTNSADTRFRLARQLWRAGDAEARREVLLALEDAPRHRGALELLLQMHERHSQNAAPADQTRSTP